MPLDLTAVIIAILRPNDLGPNILRQAYMAMQEPIANTHLCIWCGITVQTISETLL